MTQRTAGGDSLGFRPFDEPIEVGGDPFHLAALGVGPGSVDGWLNHIAAAALGEDIQPFLDEHDRVCGTHAAEWVQPLSSTETM